MKMVSEKEFVKFIRNYKGNKKASLDIGASPPMMIYKDADTGEIIGRYPELGLIGTYSYKDMYYEVKDC